MWNPHAATTRSCGMGGQKLSLEATFAHTHSFSLTYQYLCSHGFTNSHTYTFTPLRSHSLTRTIVPLCSSYFCSRRAPLYSCCTHCTRVPRGHTHPRPAIGVAASPPRLPAHLWSLACPLRFFDADVDMIIPTDIDRKGEKEGSNGNVERREKNPLALGVGAISC